MKPEVMEELAHKLMSIKNNLELQAASDDMLHTLNIPKYRTNKEIASLFSYRLSDTLHDNLQNMSNSLDDVAAVLYQTAERVTAKEELV